MSLCIILDLTLRTKGRNIGIWIDYNTRLIRGNGSKVGKEAKKVGLGKRKHERMKGRNKC